MRYLNRRLIEGLLEEMAVDSSLRMLGGAGVGKDTATRGTLVFAICGESTTGEIGFGAADPSQMLLRKHFPLLVHITPRGRPIITREILQVVNPSGIDTCWVECPAAQPASKLIWKVPIGFIACASA